MLERRRQPGQLGAESLGALRTLLTTQRRDDVRRGGVATDLLESFAQGLAARAPEVAQGYECPLKVSGSSGERHGELGA